MPLSDEARARFERLLKERADRRAGEFSDMNSYERVMDVLLSELNRLDNHATWERYGDRDGPHPPMEPEHAERYSQLLGLRMKLALEGKDVPQHHFKITDEEGWVYSPTEES
jgi:hypothetical protein